MKIIIIGSSTGGPYILEQIFSGFPDLQLAIIIIQHLPASFIEVFRRHIISFTKMEVLVVEDHCVLSERKIFVAPSGFHLLINNNRICTLNLDDKMHGVRPAVDKTMLSLQKRKDDHLMGIILTGMGRDGADGIIHMHSCGAITIAQDPASSPIKSMPQAAIDTGHIDQICTPGCIRQKMIEFGKKEL
jgi:two-component system, chemotaxis family, protein-glutamate methylesterase/glutaminase